MTLTHGWLPVSVQILTAVAVVAAVGWRTRRWRTLWLPWSTLIGVLLAVAVYCYIESAGVADDTDPAPRTFWLWIALCGFAFGVLLAGWRGARWWVRGAALLAVPLCVLSTALVLNLWVGYFPTVQTAWSRLTAGPLPDQTDQVTVTAMQRQHRIPIKGSVLTVDIPATASGFTHRREFVYLPPAWFADPPPALPVVMMIGGEFNTPADWLGSGGAVKTLDDFAATHGGYAPVIVFVDAGGTFRNDTECVNGTRGNAADHLVKDVVPYVKSHYGVSPNSANWGVVGFSMGGTCSVDLSVMHPDIFGAFVDIAGDAAPNAGNQTETVDRLFGGNTDAYLSFDPASVLTRHGPYQGLAGWFDVNSSVGGDAKPNDQALAADRLCGLAIRSGIDCAVVSQPGNHDWPFASNAFATALPWLAARIGTPRAPQVGFPTAIRG
ncbi:alpha/beta hydrolase family protein [Mycobacterium sp. NAZ190054]|uniref:alpha/beta hydrolase n=1 Tax=Mycobacterium sp. NAZ190054 TaxID=1747766 RepID=UPI001E507E2F|nr:alpha/beta hydrolase-fold protein [Mycobacterium sp. NAZ190054]